MKREKNIILIFPSTEHDFNHRMSWTPFSILNLAGPLQNQGYNVILLDENVTDEDIIMYQIVEKIDESLFVGISCMLGNQIKNGIKFAKFIRNINPIIPIVWGGPHPTLIPETFLNNSLVDIVVRGQGEKTIVELAVCISNDMDLSLIKGISYKTSCGLIHNPDRSFTDINSFPSIPWNLIQLENYIRNDYKLNSRTIAYVSSQGCPYGCGFCSENGINHKRWSGLKVERILEDLSYFMKRYNVNAIKFNDSDFFVDKGRADLFCREMVKFKNGLKWFATMHPKEALSYSENEILALKESGCKRLLIGAESGSQEVLDLIKKGIKVDDLYLIAERFGKAGIIINFTVIVGFPGVSKREISETIKLATNIKRINNNHDIKFHFFDPTPGSPLYSLALKNGLIEPKGLEEWAQHNRYEAWTEWIDKKNEYRINAFNRLYLNLGFPSDTIYNSVKNRPYLKVKLSLYKFLSNLRIKLGYYNFPFEWNFYYRLKRINLKDKHSRSIFQHI